MHIRMRLNRMTSKVNAIVMYVNHTIMIQLQCALSPLDNALHRSYSDFSTIFVVISWPNRTLINRKNYKRDRGIISALSYVETASIFSVISSNNRLIKPDREMRIA